jgi:hypothetical protein
MTAPRRKLTDAAKEFIVCQLAAYETQADVARKVKDLFGIEVTKQTVHAYDPTTSASEGMAEKWKILFRKARKQFLESVEDIPEANRAVRIRMLAEGARKAKDKGNHAMMAQLLEQIAKETGEVFTNKRELTGKGGGPIQFADLTDEQLDRRLVELMAGAGAAGGRAE